MGLYRAKLEDAKLSYFLNDMATSCTFADPFKTETRKARNVARAASHADRNQRQPRQTKDDFKLRPKPHFNRPAEVPFDDPSNYQLSRTGKFEPASHLPTIELSDNSHSGRGSCNMCAKCRGDV